MILSVALPRMNPDMRSAVVEALYAAEGGLLQPGAKLIDLKVDLSVAVAHDCPPVTYHRIALRDRAWLRRVLVGIGDEIPVGAPLLILSTDPEESLDAAAGRAARTSVAGIMHQTDWWSLDG